VDETKPNLQLQPRTTYVDGRGDAVPIVGLIRNREAMAQNGPLFWSVNGFWYFPDGRRVSLWDGDLAKPGQEDLSLVAVSDDQSFWERFVSEEQP